MKLLDKIKNMFKTEVKNEQQGISMAELHKVCRLRPAARP